MSQLCSNNNNSFNTVNVSNNFTVANDRSNILAWLSPLDPGLRHRDIRERRVEDIGEWLFETEEFRSWCTDSGGGKSSNAVLFCYGDPGVGKTHISSLVIDRLCDQARGQNATVTCFYFDFAVEKEQSSLSMLRALLKQLVGGLEETPEEILRTYQDQKDAIGRREPGLSDVVKMLQTTTSKKRTFICIDALDECVEKQRVNVLDSLGRIVERCPGSRIFMTGRPHVWPEIERCLPGRVTSLSITTRRDDITSYLHTRLHEDTNRDAMDCCLEADILRKIPEDISEVFLLVSLSMDAILQETTIRRRRQKLSAMTDGLGLEDAYSTTLGRIRSQGRDRARLGIAALMWISHSERPLKPDELCHALAVEIRSPDLDTDGVPSIRTLLACCQGLVVVDKEACTVRLIHLTLQEYLRAHPDLFGSAHATMAETCLSYLNSQQAKALSSPNFQNMPFVIYSSLYWGAHAKKELSDCAKSLALKLFDGFNNHISTRILLKTWNEDSGRFINFDKSPRFSGLHCASFFGIVEIVASFMEVEGCDINQKDCMGNTPLVWAALGGHEGVVKILLGRDDVSPDQPDNNGRTPLNWAAGRGEEGVVKILLGREDVNPDEPDNGGQTPLSRAAAEGHEGVVEILLGRDDVSPDKPDNDDRTPLSRAACNGREGVVKMLLERDGVNPDKPDNDGSTPLSWAALSGYEGVVKILLRRDDVKPDKPDNDGRTPLSWAAESGCEGVAKILLGREDVNPNRPDIFGQTPLSWAAWCGYEGMVKVLLGQDDVKPDKPDNCSQTPLMRAAQSGNPRAVALLQPPASSAPSTA